ncbi:DJ-1/PfpI family protein [Kineococcus sp. SYSU DK002]|uniref:DJ-1/PfpI family protein n=1 Tax=Kineococcus sp. SYSU DK002 TaxID=3383123 RepID=UPI003D7D7B3E
MTQPAPPPRRVGIVLFDDVEVLDACGPFEVLSVADRVAARAGRPAPFEVVLLATGDRPGVPGVRARGGLRLGADHRLADAPACDVVLVPGGVVDAAARDGELLTWLAGARAHAELVASVCTGAFVLAAAGLLDGRPVTTHWEDVADLRARWPHLRVVEGVRFVDHGDVATSAGISAALDLALHLVERLAGRDLALATARQMDYAWRDEPHPGGPVGGRAAGEPHPVA